MYTAEVWRTGPLVQLVAPCAVIIRRGHDLFLARGRDAFREKGLLAPKQAGWAGNAAAKLAKPAGGLKVREESHLELLQMHNLQAPTKVLVDMLEHLLYDVPTFKFN